MSNPWARGRFSADALYRWAEEDWKAGEIAARKGLALPRSALRIRHGARAACKRLRRERDEARGHYRWMVEHAADQKLDGYRELGARAAAAENERDAARLELAALEWLTREGAVEDGRLFWRNEKPWTQGGAWERGAFRDRDDEHDTYASAARALGWEG